MSKPERQRIFDPGFSTKARGWGMGLALVRRIVEEYHRGRVELARSVEGEGSSFRIRIPAV
jgi:signal transduction histidine kinase